MPQLQIEIDRERAARYGLNVADVQDVIETALGGKEATEIWEGERKFGVVVRLREDAAQRSGPAAQAARSTRPTGSRMPLEDVAHIGVRGGSMNISREIGHARGGHRRLHPAAATWAASSQEMQDQRRDRTSSCRRATSMTWGGEFENQQRAMARLAVIVPISVLLIFLLLFNAFGSVQAAPLLILLEHPVRADRRHPRAAASPAFT